MATIQNIPKLRFPGFKGEWEKSILGDIGKIKMCKRVFNHETSETAEIPFYKIGTFGKVADAFITNEHYLDYKTRFSFPKPGEILLSAAGTLGRTVVYDGSPSYFQDSNIVWIANNEKFTKNSFLFYIYQIVRYDSEGGTIQRLYNSIISKTKFYNPSLPEQQKIASFLSAVDEKIQQLSRKKELLEQYKKGVMQQLFSGKLRFKDENGNDYPDWEEKKLGEVANKKSSNISANKIEDNFGDFIIYGASGILKKVDFYKEENDYISIVKDGAGVGRLLYCKGKSSVLGTMEIISPKQNLDTYFLYCLLSNIDFVKYVTGSTIPHIYFKDYSNEICGIPNFTEQQKIANFLSNIDVKIENTNQEIIQMQKFKKGLLQQLFV